MTRLVHANAMKDDFRENRRLERTRIKILVSYPPRLFSRIRGSIGQRTKNIERFTAARALFLKPSIGKIVCFGTFFWLRVFDKVLANNLYGIVK